jgi:hypothetical protein
MNRFKKPFAALLIAVTILSVTQGIFMPRPVKAAVPTWEFNPALEFDSFSNASSLAQFLLEWAQTFVLTTLKRQLLDALVDAIIRWIQGGGEAKFVVNWKGFLANAGNQAVGSIISGIGLDFLCKPFRYAIPGGLARLTLPRFNVPVFSSPNAETACTLDKIVENIEDFYDDFRIGGWDAFVEGLKPQNNFLGVMTIGQVNLEIQREKTTQIDLYRVLSGSGYLGTQICKKDSEGNCIPGTERVTTPGDAVAGLVNKSLGNDIDFIVNADQLAEYVSAIANAIANRLIGAAEEGLLGVGTSDAPEDGVFSGGDDFCGDLPPDAQEACDQYRDQYGEQFDRAIDDTLREIQRAHDAYEQANSIYNNTVNEIDAYITKLNITRDDLDNTTRISGDTLPPADGLLDEPYYGSLCGDDELDSTKKGTLYHDIDKEIADAQTLRDDIVINRIPANLRILNQLDQAKDAFTLLIDANRNGVRDHDEDPTWVPDWAAFTALKNQYDAFINPLDAEREKANAQAIHDTFSNRATEFIQDLNKRLRDCERNTF